MRIFSDEKIELGEDSSTSAITGCSEVIGAVVASVITTCIVYVPILFIDNMMAIMFKQLAFAIIFSQCASLLTTILLVPMLASKIKSDEPNKALGFVLVPFAKLLDFMYGVYEKFLRFILVRRVAFVAIVMAMFVASMAILGMLGMTLMPDSDEGTLTVNIELPQGTMLDKTNDITLDIENRIRKHEFVENVFSNVGSGGMSILGQTAENSATVTVTLTDKRNLSTEEVAQELRDELSDVTGAIVTVDTSSTMGMSSNEIEFMFSGSDDEKLAEYVLSAEKILADIDGIVATDTSISEVKPELQIKIDSAKAALYGMSTATVSTAVSNVLAGKNAGRYTENGLEYDIDIVYPDNYARTADELRNLQIKTMTGSWISLSDVADVSEEMGYTTLTRIDQKRVVTLTGRMFNTNMGAVNKAFDEAMNALPAPDGISRTTSGTFETMMDAMVSLVIAILLGILLMYMVMAAQFESFSQPFIILFTLPLAMIGVVLSLVVTGSPMSVISCIGILMLMGIVVNNAIVLIDFVNTAKTDNTDMDRTDLLVYAGKTRMRPVLMTSLTSILGFLPMAVTSGTSGAAMMQPLAVVLVGGLTVGTFLTLLVIPVVYSMFDDASIKHKLKKQNKTVN